MSSVSYQLTANVVPTNGRHAHELSRPLQEQCRPNPAARQEEDRISQQPSVICGIGKIQIRLARAIPCCTSTLYLLAGEGECVSAASRSQVPERSKAEPVRTQVR